jgi:hypothetical protein
MGGRDDSTCAERLPRRSRQKRDLSPATDLAWGPRARDEAAGRARASHLPRLIGFWLRRARRRCRCLPGWRGFRLRRGFFPRGGVLLLVLREAAVFVFAARAAPARLVAAGACVGLNGHQVRILGNPPQWPRLLSRRAVRPPPRDITGQAVRAPGDYGRRSTCPGLILSGLVSWSLFSSKIFIYAPALPRCSLAMALSVSPALTV